MPVRNARQARQLRQSMARNIGGAAVKADRLGLPDVAAILRKAEEAARAGGAYRCNEWLASLH